MLLPRCDKRDTHQAQINSSLSIALEAGQLCAVAGPRLRKCYLRWRNTSWDLYYGLLVCYCCYCSCRYYYFL